MIDEEDKNKKDESRGFAGLSSLVSDIDTPQPTAAKKESVTAPPSAPKPAQPAAQHPQSDQSTSPQQNGKNKTDEPSGFTGLSSLVSDVETSPPPTTKKEPESRPETPSPPSSTAAQNESPQPSSQRVYGDYGGDLQSLSGLSAAAWMIGIALVIGAAFWLIGQTDNSSTPSSVPAYTSTVQSSTSADTALTENTELVKSPQAKQQASSRPLESMPPIGENNVLSVDQIRYCLAEDIRLNAAKSVINTDTDVDLFNAMVNDYNRRCESYRYTTNNRGRNDLSSAKKDVELYREQLYAEGRRRFVNESLWENKPLVNNDKKSNNNKLEVYETSFDCSEISSIPEYLICHDPYLAKNDLELERWFSLAKILVLDKAAFQERARKQWNYRQKNCRDKSCLLAWFEYQKAIMKKISETRDYDAQLSDEVEQIDQVINAVANKINDYIYQTSFDCSKIKSIPEYLICHDSSLAQNDLELASLFRVAKLAVADKEAFQERARNQWNYREKKCRDKACVSAWYRYQKEVMSKIYETGDVNAKIN